MRYWEFLIQQEGDQTWLPLETRQVEILEGRYRMAAHTSYDDTSVEVRVSQLLLDEIPPRRRVRKRRSVTNDSGLLAIFPFMQLSPGRWEIDCNSPDVIDDFLGESWHYSVQLQVTPRDEDDWEPNWSDRSMGNGRSQPTEDPPNPDDISLELASDQGTDGDLEAPEFQLDLKQQAYVTEVGQALTLTGHIAQNLGDRMFAGQLWVELRDPQTASVLKEMPFELPAQRLPAPFKVTIALPDELSTQVILGAISLHPEQSAGAPSTPLVSAAFTVTIGLADMLDAIANQPDLEFEEEISIFPGSTEAFVPPADKTEALITGETPIIPKEIIPSEGLTLPPQIKPPSPNEVDDDPDRQPELPEFPAKTSSFRREPQVAPAAEPSAEPAKISADIADDRTPEPPTEVGNLDVEEILPEEILSEEILPQEPLALDIDELSSQPDAANDTIDYDEYGVATADSREQGSFAEPSQVFPLESVDDDELDFELAAAAQAELPDDDQAQPAPSYDFRSKFPVETASYRSPSIEPPPTQDQTLDQRLDDANLSIDRAFEKLQLRERFWQKLSSFTQDGYRQSLEVKRALRTSDTLPEGNPQSNEFVAYEPRPQRVQSRIESTTAAKEPLLVQPPILEVPPKELVAGEWLAIKVKIPVADYHPYVKVWMNDLQTRTVIEAPRMLMQFIPNDYNELETLMRVKVPSGCLELQIAAIAVDMSTLQESRKVVQNRRVMPPDDTLSVFDDWDM